MIEASTQFMVGRLSTESGKCNRFNLDGIFGNDKRSDGTYPFVRGRRHSGARGSLARRLAVLCALLPDLAEWNPPVAIGAPDDVPDYYSVDASAALETPIEASTQAGSTLYRSGPAIDA